VIRGGVVSGTWAVSGQQLVVSWFGEAGEHPRAPLLDEAARVAAVLGRELETRIEVV
jgi:hypothetical protein